MHVPYFKELFWVLTKNRGQWRNDKNIVDTEVQNMEYGTVCL